MTTKSSAPTKSIPPLVIRSAIVASLGGLLFGFDTAVISGAEEKLTKLYALSSMGEGMIVAIATIGTICGAIVAGKLADRFGRKPILFWIGILFGVGALATALAPVPSLIPVADGKFVAASSFPIAFFMLFRFLGGIGVGLSSVVAPIYTAFTPPKPPPPACAGAWSAWSSSISSSVSSWPTPRTRSSARSCMKILPGAGCLVSWLCRLCSS